MIINRPLLITMITVAVSTMLQFIYIRYVSYNVDREIYGNFVLLQTLVVALSYIFLQIPAQAYDRFYNQAKDKIAYINEFRTLLILVNIISIFIIVLYGYFIDKFSFEILAILFVYFALLNNYNFNQKIFLLNLERKKYFYLKTMDGLSKFIAPIIAYSYFQSLIGFLIGLSVGYFVSFVIMIRYMKSYPFKVSINLVNYKKYFTFAYPVLFTATLSWGISFSDRYFIEFLSGTKDVAIYAILAQVAGIGQIFGQIYGIYIHPEILKMYEKDKKKTFTYMTKTLKYLLVMFALLGVMAYFIPYQIYALVIDIELIEQSYFFNTYIILVIGIFLTVFQTAMSMYLVLLKKLNILTYIYGLAFIVNIIGNFFIDDYGIMAAAISTLLAYMVLSVGQVLYLYRSRALE